MAGPPSTAASQPDQFSAGRSDSRWLAARDQSRRLQDQGCPTSFAQRSQIAELTEAGTDRAQGWRLAAREIEEPAIRVLVGQAAQSSRANLRPRSRSASVIDRLFENQNLLENRNNLRSSSPRPGPGQTFGQPRRNFAVRNSSTREPWLFRSPVFGSGIRRLERDRIVITGPSRFQPARPEVLR